jgi:hypothetical protein
MAKRKDIHRPSALVVADYAFIKYDYLPSGGDVLGDAMFLAEERARFNAHREKTGATYGENCSAGSCYVCGAAAVYTATFYHKPSNKYICTGLDCASNLDGGDPAAFKKNVKAGLEAAAGKKKAKAVLEAAGLGKAWELVEADALKRKTHAAAVKAYREANPEPELVEDKYGTLVMVGFPEHPVNSYEERTALDIISRLVKWGNISEKATNYLGVLLDKIERAPEIEAAKAAAKAVEKANEKPVPLVEGRVLVKGEVLTLRGEDGPYGHTTKMLVKCEGFKLWGTCPAALLDARVEKGDVVEFAASIKRSDRDEAFGFWSRPSKAKVVKEAEKEAA